MPATRLRFELLFAAGCILFGALVLPALVYIVGTVLLGNYADGGLGSFYGNLYRDLISGSAAPLAMILGPYVTLMVARLPLLGRRKTKSNPEGVEDRPAVAPSDTRSRRVEPRIGN